MIDCSDASRPRLVTTDGQCGAYVALSYVWGQRQPNRLQRANIDTYAAGINPALIPQTILDAIKGEY